MQVIIRSCFLFLCVTLVNSKDCTREDFLNGALYDSNFDTHSLEASYSDERQVRLSCIVGFTGFFKLICKDGNWTFRGSKCQPKSCGHPGEAQFADFHLTGKIDDFVFGSQVEYICHKGYQMVSRRNHRNCLADGWDGMVPVCEAIQCAVVHVDNNVKVTGNPEEAAYGNVVRFSCRSSSEVLVGPLEIYCDENGEWKGVGWKGHAPKCEEIKCQNPVIENGFVPGDIQEYKENEVLNFMCNNRYQPVSVTSSKCTKVGQIADWSPTPACELLRCPLDLTPPRGTTYQPASRSLFLPGEKLRVTCGEKYWIENVKSSSTEVLCTDDGKWSTRPVCLEVICSNHRDEHVDWWQVSHWQQKKLGDTVRYRCRWGYKNTAPDSVTRCTRDGWMPQPLCQEITCKRKSFDFADFAGSMRAEYKYDERVEYVCKNKWKDRFSLTCGAAGWSGSSHCTFSWCDKLNIKDAAVTSDSKSWYQHGEEVHYSCIRSGEHLNLTCDDGVWKGTQTCSETKPCPKADVPHGFVVRQSKNLMYYTCDADYKLPTKGWWAVSKCIDGVWSGLHECMEKTECGEPPVIPHGKATPHRSSKPDQTLQISCNKGYRPGTEHLTCQDGEWHSEGTPLQNICTPVAAHCSPPPRVENAVVLTSFRREFLSNSSVTYQCRGNYTMEGEGTIRCHEGKWEDKNTTCIRKTCPEPEEIPDGTHEIIVGEQFFVGTIIKYTCNKGFRIVDHNATRTCLMDGWTNSVPRCERVTCKVGDLQEGLGATGLPLAGETIQPGQKLLFQCNEEQHLDGASEIECLSTGEWSQSFPTCSDYCKVSGVPSNMNHTLVTGNKVKKGGTLTFSCRLIGEFLQGNATVECLSNGNWSSNFPKCEAPGTCKNIPDLEDGDVLGTVKTNYQHNEKVVYKCQNFYVMEGGPHRTCSNGEWIGEIRCIKPCTINEELLNRHNIEFRYSYEKKKYSRHNQPITFMCKSGRPVGSVAMRQTCLEGQMQLPTCQ